MSDNKAALYEGLFLINQQEMAGDLDGALSHIREMLDRAEAEVVSLRKWDERKLAYPVNGQKRGLFILALFRVRPVQVANIERDCNLSELVMRVLMTRADHYGEVEIEAELKEAETSATEAKLKSDQAKDEAKEQAAEAPSQPASAEQAATADEDEKAKAEAQTAEA